MSRLVLVATAHPVRTATTFSTSIGHEVQIVIVDVELVVAAVVTRVGVKYSTLLILVEDAVTLSIARLWVTDREVVEGAFGHHFLWRERYLVVEVEVRAAGGY